jgi:hypothetical protein
MAALSINRMTHVKDDMCGIQSYYAQSVGPGRYTTTNLTPSAREVNPIAMENQMVYVRDGYGVNNTAIDTDSSLKNHPVFKNGMLAHRADFGWGVSLDFQKVSPYVKQHVVFES